MVNVVVVCADCNFAKHDMTFTAWLSRLEPVRAEAVRRLYVKRYGAPPEQPLLL